MPVGFYGHLSDYRENYFGLIRIITVVCFWAGLSARQTITRIGYTTPRFTSNSHAKTNDAICITISISPRLRIRTQVRVSRKIIHVAQILTRRVAIAIALTIPNSITVPLAIKIKAQLFTTVVISSQPLTISTQLL